MSPEGDCQEDYYFITLLLYYFIKRRASCHIFQSVIESKSPESVILCGVSHEIRSTNTSVKLSMLLSVVFAQ